MELDVDRLAAQGVVLAFERPFGRHRVVVGPSHGVSGQIASDHGGTFIDARTPDVLELRELVWQLQAGAVSVMAELALREVCVELSIPRGASPAEGRITVGSAASGEVRLEHAALGSEPIAATDVAIRGLAIVMEAEATVITVEEARIASLAVPIAGEQVRLDALLVSGLEVRVSKKGGWQARFGGLQSGEVTLPLGEARVAIDALAFRDGVSLGADGIRAAVVAADAIRLSITDLERPKMEDEKAAPQAKGQAGPLDLQLLDRLRGTIQVDLTTDLRLPVLGTRRATHEIRLEVREGMIEYGRLEKGLARLEDSVLDFAIREGRLVLEKDIPFIPFDRKTLVSWALDGDERRLADEGWVRLSRLARPQVEIESKPKNDGEEGMIREISAEGIDVVLELGESPHAPSPGLDLPGGTRLRLGGDGASPAFERLRIRGGVVYRPDDTGDTNALELEGEQVVLGLQGLPLGPRRATVHLFQIGRVAETKLHLKGIRLAALESHLEAVELRDLFITPPEP